MKTTHLLDTSVYAQPLRARPIESVRLRWQRLGDDRLAVSVLSAGDLMFGLQAAHDESRQPLVEALLGQRIRVISVDTEVARHYARLKTLPRVQNGALSDRDLYVAATAKVHGLVLATLNPSVFQRIDGLAVEDWSQPE